MDTVGSTGDEEVEERLESQEVVQSRGKARVTFEQQRRSRGAAFEQQRNLRGATFERWRSLKGVTF